MLHIPVSQILTERHIVKIADRLTHRPQIIRLGLDLEMNKHIIDAAFTNYPHSITSVADEILFTWFRLQGDRDKAYITLGDALVRSNLNMIARDILDYPPRPATNGLVGTKL